MDDNNQVELRGSDCHVLIRTIQPTRRIGIGLWRTEMPLRIAFHLMKDLQELMERPAIQQRLRDLGLIEGDAQDG